MVALRTAWALYMHGFLSDPALQPYLRNYFCRAQVVLYVVLLFISVLGLTLMCRFTLRLLHPGL